ncbi:hypothetical protein M1403_00550 [Patescibacteria group bacterium]|nr:hypothetical protein [Patescibacteria group bacterium]
MRSLFPKILFIGLIFVVSFLTSSQKVFATDVRTEKVANFLQSQNSPLVYFAQDFVEAADKNHLDYRLLVAISGVESTFGKYYLRGTYNAYGWGGGLIYFKSWPDGISSISADLKTNYVDKGVNNVWSIGRIYCPPNSANWSAKVQYFMEKIDATPAAFVSVPVSPEIQALPLTI